MREAGCAVGSSSFVASNLLAQSLIANADLFVDYVQYYGLDSRLEAGTWDAADRRACALEVFRRTAAYDGAIAAWLEGQG